MSTAPTAGGYELEFGIITLLVAAPVLALYIANRDLYPIAQREPLMAFASNVGHTVLVSVGFLEVVGPGMPLFLRKIISQVCFAVALGGLLVRIWKLYMDAGITNERVSGKHGWFIAHRQYRSRSFLMRFVAVIFLVHGAVLTVALASNTNLVQDSRLASSDGYDSILNAALIVLYFFSFAVFSVKLAGAKDGFYLKFEYRSVGLGSGFVCLVWLIKLVSSFPCAISSCNTFILWFSWVVMLAFSVIHPIWIASRDRKFGFFRCFTKMKKKSKTGTSRNSLNTTRVSEGTSTVQTPHSRPRNISFSSNSLTKLRALPLVKFLTNAQGREAFREFIVREFSVENLLFVEAVQQLRTNPQTSKEDVNNLYAEYIIPTAPNQVNLPHIVVQRLEARKNEEGVDTGVFDEAVDHVMKLMQRDAYRRFQKTPDWYQHIAVFHEKSPPQLAMASITTMSASEDETADERGDETTSQDILVCPTPTTEIVVVPEACVHAIDCNEGLVPATEAASEESASVPEERASV